MTKPSAEDIENLVEFFNQSDWEEMHLKIEGLELFLSNDPAARGPRTVASMTAVSSGATPHEPEAPAPVVIPEGMAVVRAPNLGTFFRAPKPGSPPYVEIGQAIDEDTEICLIEIMKLFTPIKAGIAGVVHEICVNDAEMVEFDQPLVIIDPSA
ncbi:MAG: biotin/lipoyl-containing protein [Gammaproteobacteria bacterium]|nr:biotin/lipoyl-containing protein [Pseudomonadota bacterium]